MRDPNLRFAIFTKFGRVVHHVRQHLQRLATRVLDALLRRGQRRLLALA